MYAGYLIDCFSICLYMSVHMDTQNFYLEPGKENIKMFT